MCDNVTEIKLNIYGRVDFKIRKVSRCRLAVSNEYDCLVGLHIKKGKKEVERVH